MSCYLLFWAERSYAQKPAVSKPVSTTQPVTVPDNSIGLDVSQDLSGQLLPFDDIYDLAVAHSPLIKLENETAVSLNAAYKVAKLQILQNANGFVNYSMGNQAIFSSNSYTSDLLGQIANGYRAGVNVNLSLFDIFGRRQLLRLNRANYQAAMQKKESVAMELKRDLITVYQDMLTAQRVLAVRIQDEQSALTAYRVAEAEMQQGKIEPRALASANNSYAQVKSITESAKGELMKNIYYLEAMVGVPLQRLKRN
ncbi:TolC family protein [Larkinella terrae]|uniref:TolC family protein n=1 Tax=Larkinella terrae TaxID=2025311 RepID=UPI001E53F7E3|nr:TolC family protein [Larkinella terrae]